MTTFEDLRKYRLGPFSGIDLVGTVIIAGWIGKQYGYGYFTSALIGVSISVPIHLAVGIETPLTKMVATKKCECS
jgi:hypothetical protein